MKTKNIFRMLLMAVVLLMGANSAEAYTLTYKYTINWQNETVYQTYELNEGDAFIVPEDGPSVEGYSFPGWGDNLPQTMPNYNYTVSVNLIPINYTITNVAGEHGSFGTNMNNNIAHVGDIVELYINPQWSYVIDQITVTAEDGTNIEVANNKFTMPAQNVTVTVTFKTNTVVKYGVWNGNQTQNGSVWANTDSAEEGATITLSSNPNQGYELDYYSISTDGQTYTTIEGNTFTMPAGNVWYSATFKQVAQTKTDVTLSFPQQAYTATMGETFTAPTLTNESGVSVTYSSSNTGVATVDASTGAVTLVGAGETTITASFAGDDSYNATSAQYTLTVSAAQEPVVVTDGETTIWQSTHDGNYWTIDASNFSNAASTTKICVYVNNTTGIWMKGGDNSWTTLWSGGTGDGGEYNGTNYFNSTYGCYEFEIGSNLSLLQASGLRIQSKGSTITKVTLLNGEHTGEPAPVPTTYTVSIANGIQNGSVSANPTNAEEGATVTLTVSPNDGYRLESLTVTDGNNQAVTVNGNQFTMPASDVTVSATFVQVESTEYTISINVTGEGTINLNRNGSTTAKEGEVITIGAQPNQHYYELGELTVVDAAGNEITVTNNQFTMPASDVTINATFVTKKYTLTWTITGDENPYLVQQVAYGETIVNPEIEEREGYVFNGWAQHLETMPAYDLTINGSFSQIYNITLVYDETKGTVTIDKSQSLGNEELHLTITPADGYRIASVTAVDANGNRDVWNNYTTFRIAASDVTVTVTFAEAEAVLYNVNYNNSQNGSVSANVNSAEAGATVTLSNQPNTGYELDYYTVTGPNNEAVKVTDDGQFTMPAGDVVIGAVFKQCNYTVTVSESENGTVVADKTSEVHYGDQVTLTITPAEGYVLDQLTVTDAYNQTSYVYGNQFSMPASDVTVTATFREVPVTHYEAVSVGSTGYATFSSTNALDFSNINGLKAYIVKSVGNGYATLQQVTGTVAARTGLILVGSSADVPITDSGESYADNMLVAVVDNDENVNGNGLYVLVANGSGVKFAETANETATVPTGHAYLNASSAQGRVLNIIWDGEATAIKGLKAQYGEEDVIYNLRGQRVTNPANGVYIVNGKKVYIK